MIISELFSTLSVQIDKLKHSYVNPKTQKMQLLFVKKSFIKLLKMPIFPAFLPRPTADGTISFFMFKMKAPMLQA